MAIRTRTVILKLMYKTSDIIVELAGCEMLLHATHSREIFLFGIQQLKIYLLLTPSNFLQTPPPAPVPTPPPAPKKKKNYKNSPKVQSLTFKKKISVTAADDLEETNKVVTKCGHKFCVECYTRNSRNNNDCAVCRKKEHSTEPFNWKRRFQEMEARL